MGPQRYVATGLRSVIERQGIRPSVIAREIHRSPSLLTMVLKGRRTLGEEDARKIADMFRLPFDLLFESSDENESSTEEKS